MKCLVCKRKFNKKYPKHGMIVRVEFSHSIDTGSNTGMWDDMGEAYICSNECYKKLTKNEELLER